MITDETHLWWEALLIESFPSSGTCSGLHFICNLHIHYKCKLPLSIQSSIFFNSYSLPLLLCFHIYINTKMHVSMKSFYIKTRKEFKPVNANYIINTLKWTGDEGEKLWWWGSVTWFRTCKVIRAFSDIKKNVYDK